MTTAERSKDDVLGAIHGMTADERRGAAEQLRKADEAKRKLDRKNAEIEAKAKAKREAEYRRQPDDMQRRELAVEGMRRYSRKITRDGDATRGAALASAADRAAEALQRYTGLGAELAAPRTDPLAEAIQAAAAELQKKLPACFPTKADAEQFAGRLPLAEARQAAALQAGKFGDVARERAKIGVEFWHIVERAARAAAGLGDNAVADLVKMGLM